VVLEFGACEEMKGSFWGDEEFLLDVQSDRI
jgi:hypothetical protein